MGNEITIALIGLGGATLGAIIQWLVARHTIRAETDRLHKQLASEFNFQQHSEWQSQFRSIMSDLLAASDPEVGAGFDKSRIIPLVLRAQLMLNPALAAHAAVNSLINQLAFMINGWHGPTDTADLLRVHGALLDASREVIYRPRTVGAG